MPGFTCCVPGCYSNSHRDKGLHFYTFPKDPELRHLWLKNVSRAGVTGCFSTFQPTNGHRLCSLHFHGGRKSYSIRVPTIFPLRGVNERRPRRGASMKRKPPAPSHYSTAVLLTSVPPGGQQQEGGLVTSVPPGGQEGVLELTSAGGADMMLMGSEDDDMSGVHDGVPTIPGVPAIPGIGGRAMAQAMHTHAQSAHPVNLTVKVDSQGSPAYSQATCHQELQVVVVGGEESYSMLPPEYYPSAHFADHSYSMSSGTTTEELLRKLNEQRDIIALMEVKMKEMKSSIRHLKITEVKLREEIRHKDKVLNAVKKKA